MLSRRFRTRRIDPLLFVLILQGGSKASQLVLCYLSLRGRKDWWGIGCSAANLHDTAIFVVLMLI